MYDKEDKSWTTLVYEVYSHAVNQVPSDSAVYINFISKR